MRKVLFLLIVLCACDDRQFIDSRLQEPFGEFINQSDKRGKKIDLSEISLVIGKIDDSGSYSNEFGNKVITINQEFFTDGQPDSLALQYIVFHEFGHFMGRGHTKEYSVMNPNKYAGVYRNSKEERIKLIDELFK